MMCSWVDVLCFADFLVGGQWSSDFEDGLFASSWSATSGLTTTDIGARLLIRDLMCFVPVCSSSYFLVSLLLSAVIGTTLPRLACGIGISIMLPLICGLPSVLDYLICSLGTWCVWVLFIMLLLLSAVDMVMVYRLACGLGIAGRVRVVLALTSVLDLLYGNWCVRVLFYSEPVLSAVFILTPWIVACGFGMTIKLRLVSILVSVLDYLFIGKWCVWALSYFQSSCRR